MSRYAEGTSVNVSQSVEEVQRLLRKFGVFDFAQTTRRESAAIIFVCEGISYKLEIPMPDPESDDYVLTLSRKYKRTEQGAAKAYEQEVRRRWRALVAVVKAKLIAVSEEVVDFQDEFLAYAVLGDGSTVGQHARPALEAAKRDGAAFTLALPGGR